MKMRGFEFLNKIKKIPIENLRLAPRILIKEKESGKEFVSRFYNILVDKMGRTALLAELPFDVESSAKDFFDDLYTILLNNFVSEFTGVLVVDISSWKDDCRNPVILSFLTRLLSKTDCWLSNENVFFVFEISDLRENILVNEIRKVGAVCVLETESKEEIVLDNGLKNKIGVENIQYLKQRCKEREMIEHLVHLLYIEESVDKSLIDKIVKENTVESKVVFGFRG